jgi:hypothetical protein
MMYRIDILGQLGQDVGRLHARGVPHRRHAVRRVFPRGRHKAKAKLFKPVLDALARRLVLCEPLREGRFFSGDGFESGVQGVDELYGGYTLAGSSIADATKF